MKTFHTFHGGRKKSVKPIAARTDQIATLVLNIAIKLYFFPDKYSHFELRNRLCCVEKIQRSLCVKYAVCITMCRFKMRLTNALVGKKKKIIIILQNLITTLYRPGYDTLQWCEWEIKAAKFTMQMADLYIPAHWQSIDSLTDTKDDENAHFRLQEFHSELGVWLPPIVYSG